MLNVFKFFIPLIFILFINLNAFAAEHISKDNINIEYESANKNLAKYILEISPKVRESVADKTGINYSAPINIKISPSKTAFNQFTGINNLDVQGVAMSEINLTVINSENVFKISKDDIFKLLEHEFSHIYLGNYISHNSGVEFPRWLNEGLAQYVSGGANELFSYSFQNSLQSAFISNKVLPFSILTASFPNTQDNFTLAYAQSLSMVEFLVKNYGADKLKVFINELKNEGNFYTAFSKVYPQSFGEIEKEWLSEKRESNYTYDYYFSTHIDSVINGLIVFAAILAFTVNFIRNKRMKKQYRLLDEQMETSEIHR